MSTEQFHPFAAAPSLHDVPTIVLDMADNDAALAAYQQFDQRYLSQPTIQHTYTDGQVVTYRHSGIYANDAGWVVDHLVSAELCMFDDPRHHRINTLHTTASEPTITEWEVVDRQRLTDRIAPGYILYLVETKTEPLNNVAIMMSPDPIKAERQRRAQGLREQRGAQVNHRTPWLTFSAHALTFAFRDFEQVQLGVFRPMDVPQYLDKIAAAREHHRQQAEVVVPTISHELTLAS